jgi:hypothetical protein
MARLLCVQICALSLLAATADYYYVHSFDKPDCKGPAVVDSDYNGCYSQDSTSSYQLRCLNSTAMAFDSFNGDTCAGPVVSTKFIASWDNTSCVNDENGQSSGFVSCENGTYTPPPDMINTYGFYDSFCPLPDLDWNVVNSVSKACQPIPGSPGTSFRLGCDATNVTNSTFSSPYCSGDPVQVASVIPLGCTSDSGGATFTTCGK